MAEYSHSDVLQILQIIEDNCRQEAAERRQEEEQRRQEDERRESQRKKEFQQLLSVCATSCYKQEKKRSTYQGHPQHLRRNVTAVRTRILRTNAPPQTLYVATGGHYDQCCLKSKDKGSPSTQTGKTITTAALTPQGHKGTSAKRVHSASRSPSTTSLPVVITFILYKGTSNLVMLPDTGADENTIGPRHLQDIGLSINELKPSPDSSRFTTDASVMMPALGSFLVDLKVKEKTTRAWIDAHAGTPVPLLSYKSCRDLALIPAEFPQLIS
ncbi:hypothetical protein E2C01_065098 [Portunus trituberculatus]|uniref:Peptidase A2 domain-containing protein n=1 Tax=Portunus trituberculatus TaxID=210409 RepID=A0A5B7HNP5_PORTR|nr:hypothetical protein [Portunus trituberculatus]